MTINALAFCLLRARAACACTGQAWGQGHRRTAAGGDERHEDGDRDLRARHGHLHAGVFFFHQEIDHFLLPGTRCVFLQGVLGAFLRACGWV